MDIVKLKTRPRVNTGKTYTGKARRQGWIPAVCYSHGEKAELLEIEARDLGKLVRNRQTTHLIDIGLGGAETLTVIKEMQHDVLRAEDFFHVDFQRVSMTEKITVEVPIEVAGVPVGVKDDGGILEHQIRRLTVRCLPMDIPEKVIVDVTHLKINQSMHVRDLKADKYEIVDSPDEVIAVVSIPAKEIVLAAPVAEAAVAGAEGAPAADGAAPAAAGAAPAAGAAKTAEKSTDKPAKK